MPTPRHGCSAASLGRAKEIDVSGSLCRDTMGPMEGKMISSLDWCSIVLYKQKFCTTTKNAAFLSFATSGPFQGAVRLEGDCSSPRGNWNFNVSRILEGSSIWEQDLYEFCI